MAGTHFAFGLLVWFTMKHIQANVTTPAMNLSSIVDQKRKQDLVDEAFLEQKDVLLDMLETKLKEVRDKKKKKSDKNSNNHVDSKCDVLPKNVDLILKTSGISAVGDAEVKLKFGKTGKGTLNLDANGISNVGQARLKLGLDEGAVHIPGLENLFVGRSILNMCRKQTDSLNEEKESNLTNTETQDTRRSGVEVKVNVTSTVTNTTVAMDNVTTEATANDSVVSNSTAADNATINVIPK
ncbi:uncharacterized protein LOC115442772 [Manduca sexta]|uniref:Uncharacterized protein n=1 Tax=Manduca sexta TaxID=7130 RepID=A0A922CK08_MANSE|nr:uncharacterized protein LOC115442772 [Manduca sexta]KAG6448987.1 hypothetical protein O3G_MSEX005798 [Manduca sexta]